MIKTGNFENDLRNGYYRWENEHYKKVNNRTFHPDFEAWLLTQGVPRKYVTKVAWVAADRGRDYSEEVLDFAYELIGIFRP